MYTSFFFYHHTRIKEMERGEVNGFSIYMELQSNENVGIGNLLGSGD